MLISILTKWSCPTSTLLFTVDLTTSSSVLTSDTVWLNSTRTAPGTHSHLCVTRPFLHKRLFLTSYRCVGSNTGGELASSRLVTFQQVHINTRETATSENSPLFKKWLTNLAHFRLLWKQQTSSDVLRKKGKSVSLWQTLCETCSAVKMTASSKNKLIF